MSLLEEMIAAFDANGHEFESFHGYVMTNCPCHHDETKSLSIKKYPNGNIGVKCHAFCDRREILKTIGWEKRNLFDTKFGAAFREKFQDGVDDDYEYLDDEAYEYTDNLSMEMVETLATQLRVSIESLSRIGIGWSDEHQAFTFPESDRHGLCIGIALRYPDGRKGFIRGGRRGIIYPTGFTPLKKQTVYVAEGSSDTAALLCDGRMALGRPSTSGGARILAQVLKNADVVIVADNDGPGIKGAKNLRSYLQRALKKKVKIITPPYGKDYREYRQMRIAKESN